MEPMQLTENGSAPSPASSGRLAGKIAIVTGSSSGIGRAIALRYAREGATVITSDINEKSRNEDEVDRDLTTAQAIEKLGRTALFVACNTADEAAVDKLVNTAVEKFGKLDIMVNNAGIGPEAEDPHSVWEFDTAAFKKTFDVNVNGVAYCVRAASAVMIKQELNANGDRGHIINIASVIGLVGSEHAVGYVASKHAVMGITRVAALDCAPHLVHVNAICPGYIKSALIKKGVLDNEEYLKHVQSLHPMRSMGEPDDIARIAVVLGSDDARWMTGTPVIVDGGYTAR